MGLTVPSLQDEDETVALFTRRLWHHQHQIEPHPAARDPQFQEQLLDVLARFTSTRILCSSL